MELQYYVANSLRISTKKSVIGVDPQSDITVVTTDLKKVNTLLATQASFGPKDTGEVFVVDGRGEYEFEDYSVKGVAAQAHTASTGDKSATIYRVTSNDVTMVFVGHIDAKLSDEQLESIGVVDVVVVP